MLRRSGIYQIMNIVNGKLYVGSACLLWKRKWEHFHGINSNVHLQHAMKKYGTVCFEFSVLEYVEDLSQLILKEQFWIDKVKQDGKELYNVAPAAGGTLGFKHSEETKALIGLRSIERRASFNLNKWRAEHRGPGPLKGRPSPLRGRKMGPSPLRGRKIGSKSESTRRLLSIAAFAAAARKKVNSLEGNLCS